MSTSVSASDGTHWLKEIPIYQSQFASRERVQEFLHNEAALLTDSNWKKFGFGEQHEYQFWAPNICAIACLSMAVTLFTDCRLSLAELTQLGLERGGFIRADGSPGSANRGWYYAPLIEVVKELGLEGSVVVGASYDEIIEKVDDNHLFVASVNPRVIRGENPPADLALPGGHLVIVVGVLVEDGHVSGLYVHNPSGVTKESQDKAFIPVDIFSAAYANRGFEIWQPNAA